MIMMAIKVRVIIAIIIAIFAGLADGGISYNSFLSSKAVIIVCLLLSMDYFRLIGDGTHGYDFVGSSTEWLGSTNISL